MSEKYFDALEKSIAAAAENHMGFLDDLHARFTKNVDEFILKQFERHGYSKKEITDLAIAGEVKTIERGFSTTYCVNGLALFETLKMTYDMRIPSEDCYELKIELLCHDIALPVKTLAEIERG